MANLDDAKVQKRLRLQLLEWLGVLPIYGFSSSSYDIDIIKKYPPQVLKHSKNMEMYPNAKSFEINSIEGELGRNIEQSEKIERYNVDGYDEESNTIYDFLGCFFH
ncbi:hypothetical protein BATDEDRAFT_87127 [Batrachochytrium dendrobatidis JAM81]|uniref:Uncharacterized protein n=1 Tax=Batrachochytrium dendrobatidis (strain JAM81 / FGSC 10211) TaxID=684364 RepID=F4NYZ9_BATDJ|nr:uncharacterized protein BATDEDRAFT_87127 [Batrachochytrium dendrobatidis JAM81]EGF82115.1 hypothetical protein BATDEDRAFT_87127 [Batrachochytrium dendrobatidis JAM81]|eukprot:XP_006677644.1 hypothetical protein BATDEDRAFT_87127 [Batrachochytrium dendrobatidis JAM81]